MIQWDVSIYVTKNFIATVTSQNGALLKDLSEYMRPVDAVVIFKEKGECLLLSEWEADGVLKMMWETKSTSSTVSMCPFSYLIKSADGGWKSAPELLVPSQNNGTAIKIKDSTIAALNLFAGGTVFSTPLQKKALSALMPTPGAKKAALELPGLRGRPQMIPRSDLEIFCTDDLEKYVSPFDHFEESKSTKDCDFMTGGKNGKK